MPQLNEISSTKDPLALHALQLRERGSCNGGGRLISLLKVRPGPVNAVVGEVNVRTGQRNLISRTFQTDETDIGCSLLPNGEGISRQANWAYGDTNYFPANVDDPYDSIVIVNNPRTGSRHVFNLHARNATIAVLRKNGRYVQHFIGPSHLNGLALYPGETVTSAGWNAALYDENESYQRRREAVEIQSAKTVAIADMLSIREGEQNGKLGSEQILVVRTDGPVNVILRRSWTPDPVQPGTYARCTVEPGEYVMGYSKNKEGQDLKFEIVWAYGDTNYFPRDAGDMLESIIIVRDSVSQHRALWNLWAKYWVTAYYWSEGDQKEQRHSLGPGEFLPLHDGDFVREIRFGM